MAVKTHEVLEFIRHPEHGLLAVCRDMTADHARIYKKVYVNAGGMVTFNDTEELGDLSRTELANFTNPAAMPLEEFRQQRDYGSDLHVQTQDPTTGPARALPTPTNEAAVDALRADFEAEIGNLRTQVSEAGVDQAELAELREELAAARSDAETAKADASAARQEAQKARAAASSTSTTAATETTETTEGAAEREVVGAGAGGGRGRGGARPK